MYDRCEMCAFVNTVKRRLPIEMIVTRMKWATIALYRTLAIFASFDVIIKPLTLSTFGNSTMPNGRSFVRGVTSILDDVQIYGNMGSATRVFDRSPARFVESHFCAKPMSSVT